MALPKTALTQNGHTFTRFIRHSALQAARPHTALRGSTLDGNTTTHLNVNMSLPECNSTVIQYNCTLTRLYPHTALTSYGSNFVWLCLGLVLP